MFAKSLHEHANADHFAFASGTVIEGMESCEDFFQLTQAKVTHSALHAIASERDKYPKGRETTNTAGMKMKATASRAAVVVYPVPVDF